MSRLSQDKQKQQLCAHHPSAASSQGLPQQNLVVFSKAALGRAQTIQQLKTTICHALVVFFFFLPYSLFHGLFSYDF